MYLAARETTDGNDHLARSAFEVGEVRILRTIVEAKLLIKTVLNLASVRGNPLPYT